MTRSPRQSSDENVGYQTRAVSRALAILDAFGDNVEMLSVGDLHRRLDLPKPTVVRLTSLLQQHGYLSGTGDGYAIGPKAFQLGSLYMRRNRLVDLVAPLLEAARDELMETVCLATLDGADILHLSVARSLRPVHYVTEVGSRAPAHSTGLGKALLAAMDDAQVEALLGNPPYPQLTENTRTTREALLEELARTRRRGYAIDDEESALGLKCVAVRCDAPLLGRVAVSVSGAPPYFTAGAVRSMAETLGETAKRLASALAGVSGETAVVGEAASA